VPNTLARIRLIRSRFQATTHKQQLNYDTKAATNNVHPPSAAVTVDMRLVLSRLSHLNAVYSDEDGQAIYKVHSPFKFKGRTSTISKIMPNGIPSSGDIGMQDRFAHLAQIDWKLMTPSIIRFGGIEVDVKTFFRVGRLRPHGR